MRKPNLSLTLESLLYIAAGINHFWHEDFYASIMPDHYTHLRTLVELTGAAEIAGGLGLLSWKTRRHAAFGIVLMLLGYFDVHIHMLRHADRFPTVPRWALWARIPLQFALIAWAAQYARKLEPPALNAPKPEGG